MINRNPLRKQIEQELKNEIINGIFSPGQKISIEELALKWEVSTTPIRDAIQSLESIGFVKITPRKAVYVTHLDAKAFKDIFDIRIALECMAAELAITILSDEQINLVVDRFLQAKEDYEKTGDRAYLASVDNIIHDMLILNCGNQKLIDNLGNVQDLIRWARSYVARQPASYENALPEHLAILDAIRRRDANACQDAMRVHLRNSYHRTLQTLLADKVEMGIQEDK